MKSVINIYLNMRMRISYPIAIKVLLQEYLRYHMHLNFSISDVLCLYMAYCVLLGVIKKLYSTLKK